MVWDKNDIPLPSVNKVFRREREKNNVIAKWFKWMNEQNQNFFPYKYDDEDNNA